MNTVDFHCRACGKETAEAPDLPDRAICEECCGNSEEGHDYYYEAMQRHHVCKHCGMFRPEGW